MLLYSQVFRLLQSASNFHIQLLDGFVLLEHLRGRQLACLGNLSDFRVPQSDNNILRFEISVDNLAHSMHVIKADQTLASKLTGEWHGHSLIIVSLDYLQEVDSKDLKYHDEVLTVRPMMDERIEQLHAVRSVT